MGTATTPFALLLRGDGLEADVEAVEVDLDGSGLLSSPLGLVTTVRLVTLGGSGLLSSPLGFRSVSLVGLDGSGLLSSPLGFHATNLYALGGSGLLSSPLGIVGTTALSLSTGMTLRGSSLEGTVLQSVVDREAGLRTEDGYEPASLLVGTGAVSVGLGPAVPATLSKVRWTP